MELLIIPSSWNNNINKIGKRIILTPKNNNYDEFITCTITISNDDKLEILTDDIFLNSNQKIFNNLLFNTNYIFIKADQNIIINKSGTIFYYQNLDDYYVKNYTPQNFFESSEISNIHKDYMIFMNVFNLIPNYCNNSIDDLEILINIITSKINPFITNDLQTKRSKNILFELVTKLLILYKNSEILL